MKEKLESGPKSGVRGVSEVPMGTYDTKRKYWNCFFLHSHVPVVTLLLVVCAAD